jgi:ATP-dependent DNA helicase RecG
MNRLLQGEVGSGKTILAALVLALAAENGLQAALMAPTEVLAEQHARSLEERLAPLGLAPVLLTSSVKGAARRERLAALASGAARIAVGTHALIEEGVAFDRLGLIVVDEQHRFGVLQRARLGDKGAAGGDNGTRETKAPRRRRRPRRPRPTPLRASTPSS